MKRKPKRRKGKDLRLLSLLRRTSRSVDSDQRPGLHSGSSLQLVDSVRAVRQRQRLAARHVTVLLTWG